MKLTYKNVILSLVFVLFLFVLRANSFTAPFERDEGEYAYSAMILRHGSLPYQNSFIQKPPLIIYTYFLSQEIFDDTLWGPRLLAFVSILFTSYFIYKVVDKYFDTKASWVSVFIFAALVSSPINASLAANTEIFMLLPIIVFYWIYLKDGKDNINLYYFLAGTLSAAALFFKPICLYVLVLLYLLWTIRIYKKQVNKLVEFLLLNLVGFCTASFLFLAPFLGVLNYFWEEVVIFNAYYAKQWGFYLNFFWINLKAMWPSFWIVFSTFIMYLFINTKRKKEILAILFLCLVAVFQTAIRHYYILLTPFLVIAVSQVLVFISQKTFSGAKITLLTTLFLFLFLWPVRIGFGLSPEKYGLWVYGSGNPFGESVIVSKKVREVTREEDLIFVAGSEPQIYYYTKRYSPTRFVITYPFIIDTKVRSLYQVEAVTAISKNPPKVIVYSTRDESGLWNNESPRDFINYLDNLIDKSYRVGGAYVWDSYPGRWINNPSDNELNLASLIMYVKK